MNRETIIKNIIILKRDLHNLYKAQIKGIFGSVARNEATENSDIDILVNFDHGATLIDQSGVIQYIQDKLGIKADVVSERALRPEIKEAVYKDLILI